MSRHVHHHQPPALRQVPGHDNPHDLVTTESMNKKNGDRVRLSLGRLGGWEPLKVAVVNVSCLDELAAQTSVQIPSKSAKTMITLLWFVVCRLSATDNALVYIVHSANISTVSVFSSLPDSTFCIPAVLLRGRPSRELLPGLQMLLETTSVTQVDPSSFHES